MPRTAVHADLLCGLERCNQARWSFFSYVWLRSGPVPPLQTFGSILHRRPMEITSDSPLGEKNPCWNEWPNTVRFPSWPCRSRLESPVNCANVISPS